MSMTHPEPLIWRKASAAWMGRLSGTARLQLQLRLSAEFAAAAASSVDLAALQDEICKVAAEGLGVEFAKLLVYRPDERVFVMEAGVGWRDGVVGHARFAADDGAAAGFAWRSGQSVLANDIVAEGRFRTPPTLAEHGIVRSINVVVPGGGEEDGAAFGVLEAESPEPGRFVPQDVYFLQLLAHSLAAATARGSSRRIHQAETADEAGRHLLSLQEMQHRVRNDLQGIVVSLTGEARAMLDPLQREGFERVSRRIMALAGLYDHLLRGSAADRVDLAAYLGTLCEKVASAADFQTRGIVLVADARPLAMRLDHAVRLATAVNELVANAAAHAFPDGRPGTITVRLRPGCAGGPVLSVIDDGRGFAGPRPGGAGLRVVEGLVWQVGGILTRGAGPGMCWRIKLPPAETEQESTGSA